jgi:hypothetical protein
LPAVMTTAARAEAENEQQGPRNSDHKRPNEFRGANISELDGPMKAAAQKRRWDRDLVRVIGHSSFV